MHDIFYFPGLHITLKTQQSKDILNIPDPKIIIAGSGMSTGGRILHHEKNYLSNPNTTLLLLGYQAIGTLGRKLDDGIKNITSGEGGCVVTCNNAVLAKVRDARLLGVEKDTEKRFAGERSWAFDVTAQGWRYHMSNIMAAIGRVQFQKFQKFQTKRQMLATQYSKLLSDVENIKTFDFDFTKIVPHIYVIRILNGQRDFVKQQLLEKGIQTGIHYKPNHFLNYYKTEFKFPKTERFYSEILTLPLHPDLSEKDINFICKSLKALL